MEAPDLSEGRRGRPYARRERAVAAAAAWLPGVTFVLESGPAGHIKFVMVGERAPALLGIDARALCQDPEALLGRMQTPARNSFVASLAAAGAAEVPWQWEGQVLAGGTFRWVHGVAQPLRRAGGDVLWCGLLLDSSAQHAQGRALEQAVADLRETLAREQMRSAALASTCDQLVAARQGPATGAPAAEPGDAAALQRLARGLAHEINNPLAGIMMMFDRLREARSPAGLAECNTAIAAGLLRIQQAVSGLLQYAQPPPPRMRAVTWHQVACDAMALATPALGRKGQRLGLQVPEAGPGASGDLQLLVKALVNVLLNASHAAPSGSCIAVRGGQARGRVAVHVLDCGPGIPEQYIDRVCEPFFTTKQQGDGCGLGLATSSRIMAAHHGELLIRSQEGSGTEVSLWLPVAPC